MAFSISKKDIITYPPEELRKFHLTAFEWIDNLHFTLRPEDCLADASEYIRIAKEIFLADHWHGDGDIQLMWIPPFMLPYGLVEHHSHGMVIWHVKQLEDGTSWLLSPAPLPMMPPEFSWKISNQ